MLGRKMWFQESISVGGRHIQSGMDAKAPSGARAGRTYRAPSRCDRHSGTCRYISMYRVSTCLSLSLNALLTVHASDIALLRRTDKH
jgi:hypothetical protein